MQMSEFLTDRLDYIFFFYGLGFLAMAQVCLGMRRPDNEPRWFWLGLFGVTHGLNEWLDLVANSFGDSYLFAVARNTVLLVSFAFLLEFARSSRLELRGRTPGFWIYLPLLSMVALGTLAGIDGVNAVSRYTFGLGGGLWSAFVLLDASRNPSRRGSGWLIPAGVAIGLYSLATGLVVPAASFPPATVINYESFRHAAGFPVQLARGILAIAAAVSILFYAHPAYRRKSVPAYYPAPYKTFVPVALILAILVGGWYATEEAGNRDVEGFSEALESGVLMAAGMVDAGDAKKLAGGEAGPEVLGRVNSVLRLVVEGYPDALSACLVAGGYGGPRVIARYARLRTDRNGIYGYLGHPGVMRSEAGVEGPFRSGGRIWMMSVAPLSSGSVTGAAAPRVVVGLDGTRMRGLMLYDRFYSILVTGTVCVLLILMVTAWQRNREGTANRMELELTRQKLAEEKRLREIASALGDGVIVIDTEGKLSFMNPKAESLLGWKESELMGGDIHSVIRHRHVDAEPAGREECPSCRVVKTGVTYQSEDEEFTRRDGTSFRVSYVAAPIVVESRISGAVIAFQDITERKRAEMAVREREQSYRTLSENLPGIVYRVNVKDGNRMQFFNDMVLPMTGYSQEELQPGGICSIETLILDEDLNGVLNAISISMMDETPFQTEYRLRRKDGEIRYFLERGRPVRGPDGEYRYIDGVIFDITDRKRIEERFSRVNECFVGFGPDPQENIGLLAKLCGELMGSDMAAYNRLEKETLVMSGGWNVHGNLPASVPAEGRICYDIIKRGTEGFVYIEDVRNTSYANSDPELSRLGVVSYVGQPVRVSGGADGMLCMFYREAYKPDDSDRKLVALISSAIAVEEERRIAEEELNKFRFIVEGAGEEIFLLSEGGGVLYANEAACRALGYNRYEMSGLTVKDFMDEAEARGFGAHVEELKRRDLPPFETEYRMKYGKVSPKEVKSAYLEIGGESYICSFSRDITERRDLERRKDDFFAMVTHDLKSPLSIILGYSDLILTEFREDMPSGAAEMVESVRTSSRRLLRMVEDFLTISSLESRGIDFTMDMEDPAGVARMVSEEVRLLSEKTGTTFDLSVDDGLPESAMNVQYIHRALMNLLYNAFAYTPTGGRIALRIFKERLKAADHIVFEVADNGPGIPEHETASVFERYYRGETGKDVAGTGMGLAIVKAVAEAHGGKAELVSEPGKGSTFRISIPVRRV